VFTDRIARGFIYTSEKERKRIMNSLDAIFFTRICRYHRASNTPGKVGHDIFANMLKGGYKGTIYPVKPTAKSS